MVWLQSGLTRMDPPVDERQAAALERWLGGLPQETVERDFLLLDDLCRGLDVSKHEQFGFLRLRAEFETSGGIFGCSLEDRATRLPAGSPRPPAGARAPEPPWRGSGIGSSVRATPTFASTPVLCAARSTSPRLRA